MRKIVFIIIGLLVFYAGATAFLALISDQSQISHFQMIVEMLRSFTEIIAIIVAGYWTYTRFIKNREETREDFPYPEIHNRIEYFDYGGKGKIIYLSVFVTVSNKGKRKLDLGSGKIFIRQVSPLKEELNRLIQEQVEDGNSELIMKGDIPDLFTDYSQRLQLDTIGEREWKNYLTPSNGLTKDLVLEPGQAREFQFSFPIPKDVEAIEAISYFEFQYKDQRTSFEAATLYDLRSKVGKSPNNKP